MNKTGWIIFTLLTFGILVLLVVVSGGSRTDVSTVNANTIQTASIQNGKIADHVFGKVGSKVTLIEYGDYQCSACARAYPVIKNITERYKNQLQFVFRNFPLGESHPNGKAAAGVAEAAGLQGKLWKMHNLLYETQDSWTSLSGKDLSDFFTGLAKELKLDTAKLNDDLSKSPINKKINYDYALGAKSGVDATPTFYLNGKKLDQSAYGTESKFKETINSELKKAGIALPK